MIDKIISQAQKLYPLHYLFNHRAILGDSRVETYIVDIKFLELYKQLGDYINILMRYGNSHTSHIYPLIMWEGCGIHAYIHSWQHITNHLDMTIRETCHSQDTQFGSLRFRLKELTFPHKVSLQGTIKECPYSLLQTKSRYTKLIRMCNPRIGITHYLQTLETEVAGCQNRVH